MSTFVSKLQYKNFEKGEFIDEHPRDLQRTLELIRNYPWDEQRGEDIQLTNPSATIQNPVGGYLKLATYFGGKFALYLLDTSNNFYELHVSTLDEACQIVERFFNGSIDKHIFNKRHFITDAKAHFETKNFIYTVNGLGAMRRIIFSALSAIFFFLWPVLFFFFKPPLPAWIFAVFIVFLGIVMSQYAYYLYMVYLRSKNWCLNVSAGLPTFEFGETAEGLHTYNKSDIEQLIIYGNSSGKGAKGLMMAKIVFKDGSSLLIPGVLIDIIAFIAKFPGIKYEYKTKKINLVSEAKKFLKQTDIS